MKNIIASVARLGLVILCGGMVLSACTILDPKNTQEAEAAIPVVEKPSGVVVEGRIVPKEYANLFFPVGGEVVEILVDEGDQVNEGAILARLGDREALEARRAAGTLELISAQQSLADLKTNSNLLSKQAWLDYITAKQDLNTAQENLAILDTNDHQEAIDEARIEVAEAEEELQDAQETYEKYKDLAEDSDERTQAEEDLEMAQNKYDTAVRKRDRLIHELDLASSAVELAAARLEDAQRTSEARADGPDADDLALAQARLDNAQAQMNAIEAEIKQMDLLAPFDGTIVQIDISVGERAFPNQTVMMIADFSSWYVETNDLTEFDVVSISTSQGARVVPDALPDLSLKAMVDRISQTYKEKSGDINYSTRLILMETDPLLRWGMTVEVYFDELSP